MAQRQSEEVRLISEETVKKGRDIDFFIRFSNQFPLHMKKLLGFAINPAKRFLPIAVLTKLFWCPIPIQYRRPLFSSSSFLKNKKFYRRISCTPPTLLV